MTLIIEIAVGVLLGLLLFVLVLRYLAEIFVFARVAAYIAVVILIYGAFFGLCIYAVLHPQVVREHLRAALWGSAIFFLVSVGIALRSDIRNRHDKQGAE